jgi:hypothetical protein
MSVRCSRPDLKSLRHFKDGHSGKIPQFDHSRGERILLRQLIKRLMDRHQFV